MKPPLVSVIVPTYNRPALLRRALASIAAQTVKDYEIIVVNDGGESQISVMGQYPNLRYFDLMRNCGLAFTRNAGLCAAKGKYITYLDDDDVYYPRHLEVLLEAMGDNCMTAYTDAETMKPDGTTGGGFSIDYDRATLRWRNITPVLCVMHHRECTEKVGNFDETLKAHEDWDLWQRMFPLYPPRHIRQVTAAYRVGWPDSMTSYQHAEHMLTYEIVKARYQTA